MTRVSQVQAVLAVLADGEWHTVPAIHLEVGPCRLNSRVAELRARGHSIECERVPGESGAAAYRYRLLAALGGPASPAPRRTGVTETGPPSAPNHDRHGTGAAPLLPEAGGPPVAAPAAVGGSARSTQLALDVAA